MRTFSPGDIIRLWLLYQEDDAPVSGLTNLTVQVKNAVGTEILAAQSMSEIGTTGEYAYSWNTSGVASEQQLFIYYYEGTAVLDVEEAYCSIYEDMDGTAI